MASGPSGPPRLNSTTARRPMSWLAMPATDLLDQGCHMFWRGLRYDAMAQIEDQGPAAEFVQDAPGGLTKRRITSDQNLGIQIALDRKVRLQRVRRPIEIDRAIQAQPRQAGNPGVFGVHLAGAAGKQDDRHFRMARTQRGDDAPQGLE